MYRNYTKNDIKKQVQKGILLWTDLVSAERCKFVLLRIFTHGSGTKIDFGGESVKEDMTSQVNYDIMNILSGRVIYKILFIRKVFENEKEQTYSIVVERVYDSDKCTANIGKRGCIG